MSIFSNNLALHSISTHTSGSDARSDCFRALSDPQENNLGRHRNALRALKPLYQVRRIVLASDAVCESISAQRGELPSGYVNAVAGSNFNTMLDKGNKFYLG